MITDGVSIENRLLVLVSDAAIGVGRSSQQFDGVGGKSGQCGPLLMMNDGIIWTLLGKLEVRPRME